MNTAELNDRLLDSIGAEKHAYNAPDRARLTIHQNKVIDSHLVDGLDVQTEELSDGVSVTLNLPDDTVIEHPVHMCFGVIPKEGVQRIRLSVTIGKNSLISLLAHCSFPFAEKVRHIMDAQITLDEGARYSYFERHVHSESGGVEVIPKARITVGPHAVFKTEFELIKGRVGVMDIEYETFVQKHGLVDMTARISGSADDSIKLSEIANLNGEYARSVLTSKIAVRDRARAEIYNRITANAPNARGHVDCKEIVKDDGIAVAIPVVDVRNALAHVTHEAAVGSVDKKQLETLMARGLDEDEASELIIQGLLS
ncbi:MAG: SufB/SufD family protein [Spirochaetota bacterium]